MGEVDTQSHQMLASLTNWWKWCKKKLSKRMCLVQINFLVVGLNRTSLGLHIEVHEILVEGLGCEVYVDRCLPTIQCM